MEGPATDSHALAFETRMHDSAVTALGRHGAGVELPLPHRADPGSALVDFRPTRAAVNRAECAAVLLTESTRTARLAVRCRGYREPRCELSDGCGWPH